MVHEGSEVLIDVGPLGEAEPAVDMAGHDRHVLEMALAALVADGAVVGMVRHEPLDDAGAELPRLGVVDGDARPVGGRGHAGHDDPAPACPFRP